MVMALAYLDCKHKLHQDLALRLYNYNIAIYSLLQEDEDKAHALPIEEAEQIALKLLT